MCFDSFRERGRLYKVWERPGKLVQQPRDGSARRLSALSLFVYRASALTLGGRIEQQRPAASKGVGRGRAGGAKWSEPRNEGIGSTKSHWRQSIWQGTRGGIARRPSGAIGTARAVQLDRACLLHFQVRASDLTQRLYWFSRGLSISPSSNWDHTHINIEQQKPDSEPR